MLEAYTALGALASATEKIQLPTHGYMPGVITKVGEALKPLVSA
jgi:hypothetical protein